MKKFGLMFVVLLAALGVTAATFAGWTDQLVINGSVATGELNVVLQNCVCSDNEGMYNVGAVACSIDSTNKTATITIGNAYPGYEATCNVNVVSTGTIPAKVKTLGVNNPNTEIGVTTSGVSVGDIIPPTKTLSIKTTVNNNAAELGLQAVQRVKLIN